MAKMKKCHWVQKQTYQASNTGVVRLRNGQIVPVWMAFRCLYCGEYFNQSGAEEHFGKTRMEFNETEPPETEIEVLAPKG